VIGTWTEPRGRSPGCEALPYSPASAIDGLAIVDGSMWVSDAAGVSRELVAP
jgi:hypothetical protein